MPGKRTRSISARIFFSMAIIVVLFGLVEAALYLSGVEAGEFDLKLERLEPYPPENEDPPLGFLERDGEHYRTSAEALADAEYDKNPNHGPGPQRFSKRKPPGVLRVAFFGGSNMFGLGVKTGWPTVVSRELSRRLSRPVEILNTGSNAEDSTGVARKVPEILSTFKPDVAIFQTGHNESLSVPPHYMIEDLRPDLARKTADVLGRTRLYTLLRRVYFRHAHTPRPITVDLLPDQINPPLIKGRWNDRVTPMLKERLERNLGVIKRYCDRRKVRMVLVTVPYASALVKEWMENSMFAYDRSLSTGEMESANRRMGEAIVALNEKDLQKAERALQDVGIRNHGLYWSLWGKIHQHNRRWTSAARAYSRGVDLSWRPIGNVMNSVVSRFGRRHEVPVVDAHGAILRRSQHGLAGYDLFMDFMHPNEKGHVIVATEVVALLGDGG